MDADLVLTPEARDDLDEIYTWYEGRRIGAGEDFLLRVDACLAAIARTPEMHAIAFDNYRKALVRKFPYTVIYEFESDKITVYGVFHTSRNQAKWRRRLP